MKYKLIVYGCQMNKSDAERVAGVLEKIGYKKTDNLNQADLVVVLACSVRQSAMDRIFGLKKKFEQLKKLRPVVTVLTGCVLESDKKGLLVRTPTGSTKKKTPTNSGSDKGFFDAVIGIKEIGKLGEIAKFYCGIIPLRGFAPPPPLRKGEDYLSLPSMPASKFQAYVPIANGCNNFCAYCVVPYVRGREVSRPAKEVLAECARLVQNGYKEITLLGQNVNSYQSGEIGFAELLKMIDEIDSQTLFVGGDTNKQHMRQPGKLGDPSTPLRSARDDNWWLRFVTSHPKDLSDELIKVMAESRHVAPYLHLPVQSGDDTILKKMNRQYTVAHYKKLIKKMRKAIPGVAISTDVIVGFPGETQAQFQNTVKLFREVKFDLAYIARYSVRPGTAAAKLTDDVPKKEKARRLKVLTEILKQTALKNNQKLAGQTVTVLVEKFKEGYCFGKTGGFKSVKFAGSEKLVGQFVKVEIEKASAWGLGGVRIMRMPADSAGRGYCGLGKKVVVICGTTASGKTKLAVRLAKKYDGEIISADSRQVYKGMDLGTGKDLDEYVIKMQNAMPTGRQAKCKMNNGDEKCKITKIPYHCIDIISPQKQYTVAEFQRDAYAAIEDILSRGRVPILCGGTGLYIDAVVKGYRFGNVGDVGGRTSHIHSSGVRSDFNKLSLKQLLARLKKIDLATYNLIDKKNQRRVQRALEIFYETGMPKSKLQKQKKPPYEFLQLGITFPKSVLAARIQKRLNDRFQQGMIAEVKKLRQTGVSWKKLDDFGLEYRWISRYLRGKISKEEMNFELFKAIKNFSKRQLTWFRRNKNICWVNNYKEAEKMIKKFIYN